MHDGRLVRWMQPAVMGIINLTDDSFYSQSRATNEATIVSRAIEMASTGADILDLGAYSTRPGAAEVDAATETRRLATAIRAIRQELPHIPLSVDTFRVSAARTAIELGADIINDISGGTLDDGMFDFIATGDHPYILMHMRGTPATMQSMTQYDNVTADVTLWLAQRLEQLRLKGAGQVIVDPGLGFAKTLEQNYELLANMAHLQLLGAPILIGISRKSMIYRLFDTTPQLSLNGTTVLNTLALERGASILRVHDPLEASQAVKIISLINNALPTAQ